MEKNTHTEKHSSYAVYLYSECLTDLLYVSFTLTFLCVFSGTL